MPSSTLKSPAWWKVQLPGPFKKHWDATYCPAEVQSWNRTGFLSHPWACSVLQTRRRNLLEALPRCILKNKLYVPAGNGNSTSPSTWKLKPPNLMKVCSSVESVEITQFQLQRPTRSDKVVWDIRIGVIRNEFKFFHWHSKLITKFAYLNFFYKDPLKWIYYLGNQTTWQWASQLASSTRKTNDKGARPTMWLNFQPLTISTNFPQQ